MYWISNWETMVYTGKQLPVKFISNFLYITIISNSYLKVLQYLIEKLFNKNSNLFSIKHGTYIYKIQTVLFCCCKES